jgi:hypothetical protein
LVAGFFPQFNWHGWKLILQDTISINHKMKYLVLIREVHVSHRLVEADSEQEALEFSGDGEEVMCEYSHTLPKETWTVEKQNEN